jgi:hypothetical protein
VNSRIGSARLQLQTGDDCALAIGRYPQFRYDARGGGGIGELHGPEDATDQLLQFQAEGLCIPALTCQTTRILGLPLPPGLSITIAPTLLAGRLHATTGDVTLRFQARFRFRLAGLYQPPDLLIDTQLGTGLVQGQRHSAVGQPLGDDGGALLVGVAVVPPSGELWLDRFLGLPDEALAMLRCSITPVA